MNRPASLIAAIFLFLVSLAQLLRLLFGVQIIANGIDVPMWPSVLAVIVTGLLGLWLLKERRTIPR